MVQMEIWSEPIKFSKFSRRSTNSIVPGTVIIGSGNEIWYWFFSVGNAVSLNMGLKGVVKIIVVYNETRICICCYKYWFILYFFVKKTYSDIFTNLNCKTLWTIAYRTYFIYNLKISLQSSSVHRWQKETKINSMPKAASSLIKSTAEIPYNVIAAMKFDFCKVVFNVVSMARFNILIMFNIAFWNICRSNLD